MLIRCGKPVFLLVKKIDTLWRFVVWLVCKFAYWLEWCARGVQVHRYVATQRLFLFLLYISIPSIPIIDMRVVEGIHPPLDRVRGR